jgi:hypothetical protein
MDTLSHRKREGRKSKIEGGREGKKVKNQNPHSA